MDFHISPDRLELAQAAGDYLAGTHGPEVLRRIDQGEDRGAEIWSGLVEMGLTGLLVPEEEGGLGLKLLDAALVSRECGRHVLSQPLVETAFILVPWLVGRDEREGLAAIAAGTSRPTPAHRFNQWQSGGDGLAVQSIDPLRRLVATPDDASDDPLLLDLGALMTAAELLGLAEAMLAQAVEYSKIREQFGQPIGGFQAVKHKLADVAVALEFARPVVWRAAQALDDGLASAGLHISHAKLATIDAAYLAGESAIQVHGAMGYTYEVDLHFWMKRAWALGGAWGSRGFHARRVDDAIVGGGHPIGPRHTFS